MSRVKIYLADLTHTGAGVATEAMPLNVGLIASYALKEFPGKFDVELFKYPEDLLVALNEAPPTILGLSNYTWNENLAYFFTRHAKTLDSRVVTVWGGTNYPFDQGPQEQFLRERPALDFHIFYEGETAFTNLLTRVLTAEEGDNLKDGTPIGGVHYILGNGSLVAGPAPSRIVDLDSIPSPYVTGLLDKFFDGNLTPLVETARGCPFTCNFCNAGDKYFTRVHQFSDAYVAAELTAIAKKAGPLGIRHITFCDNNFGMLARDATTAQLLAELREEYGFPKSATVWTGKNSKDRVIEATRILGETLNISMSVQAMDPDVLTNISRQNIRISEYKGIADHLYNEGRPQHAEVIMPLPGETLDSHLRGVRLLLDTRVDRVFAHTLQMLYGTDYKDNADYRKEFGFITAFRLVPLDFSEINGERIFDVEEVAVATKDMTFEEYCRARRFAFMVDLAFNTAALRPFARWVRKRGLAVSSYIDLLDANWHHSRAEVQDVVESFLRETRQELWGSREELIEFYSQDEMFAKLQSGEMGGNVLFKHRVLMFSTAAEQFIDYVQECLRVYIGKDSMSAAEAEVELAQLGDFVKGQLVGAWKPDAIGSRKAKEFAFDFPKWLADRSEGTLSDYRRPVEVAFAIPTDREEVLRDAYRRYGSDLNGLIKLIQRTNYFPMFEAATVGD